MKNTFWRILKKNRISKLILLGFLPILIGGFIYLISRPKTILLFEWIKLMQLETEANVVRKFFSSYVLSEWTKFNLPDLLWVFSFTSVILIIWKDVKSKIKILYCVTPLFIGITSEVIQYFDKSFGTFDFKDIIFYFIGFILSIIIFKTINQSKNEKQITTLI